VDLGRVVVGELVDKVVRSHKLAVDVDSLGLSSLAVG